MNKTKISKEAPEWFQVITEQKIKDFDDDLIKNEDTIRVLSKFQSWITVTPRSKNRKRPLEKQKVGKMDETSKIMPKWMQNKYKKPLCPEIFRTAEYTSFKKVI
jgi:hypothetical protein